jgi:probable phosphoglycerate mutase
MSAPGTGADEPTNIGAVFGVPDGVRRVFPSQPDATRVVLVRHGEAVCNVNGVVGGRQGCSGLTELGRAQVMAVRERLLRTGELRGAEALYASTLPRAIETAILLRPAVGDGTLPVVEDGELCELHPGKADGLTWQEVIDQFGVPEWNTDPEQLIAPGGESWTGFVARAAAGVQGLARRHPGQLVVAAVHAGVIEATMISFLQIPRAAHRRGWARVLHASLTEWEWVPGEARWVLLRFNDACGVPGPIPVPVEAPGAS